jgi:hypothetical protein
MASQKMRDEANPVNVLVTVCFAEAKVTSEILAQIVAV